MFLGMFLHTYDPTFFPQFGDFRGTNQTEITYSTYEQPDLHEYITKKINGWLLGGHLVHESKIKF